MQLEAAPSFSFVSIYKHMLLTKLFCSFENVFWAKKLINYRENENSPMTIIGFRYPIIFGKSEKTDVGSDVTSTIKTISASWRIFKCSIMAR